ncbi:MAG: hypothetical protein ABI353_02080 [Isosphaeraceae bacterium]
MRTELYTIELAGEINTAMPAYVVGRIADALNDLGKPVKGSKTTPTSPRFPPCATTLISGCPARS